MSSLKTFIAAFQESSSKFKTMKDELFEFYVVVGNIFHLVFSFGFQQRTLMQRERSFYGWSLFIKMGHPRPLFCLFVVFFNQTSIQFNNKLILNNVHPVYGTEIRTDDLQNVSLLS